MAVNDDFFPLSLSRFSHCSVNEKHLWCFCCCSDFLNVIVTGSKNRSIQVWNQDNVESPTGHFDGHEGAINRVICYRDTEFTVLIR